jgi:nucleoside-diphosphate-sugar epimerase
LGGDAETQRTVGLDGTLTIARAATAAGVERLVHVSTAAVYDRRPGTGDVDEHARLVPDDAGAYAVVKRDVDAALEALQGTTRVLLRPPAVLGAGETSVWNSVRPAQVREDPEARHAVPDQTFAWVHVDDLTALAADVAVGLVATTDDPESGLVEGGCTAVNVASGPATNRDYYGAVTRALGVEPAWEDGDAWTGQVLADRARRWGWSPRVGLDDALAELEAGLRS